MPLYKFIKLVLVAPVNFFLCERELYGCNLIACVFCFDVFCNIYPGYQTHSVL